MRPAIVGTLLITGAGAALMAIPLGILGAIYLNEYGKKRRLASAIRFMTDVMTGVPSVVMGIFIYTVWVAPASDSERPSRGALALGLPDAADRGAVDRGDAQARPRQPARGERRARARAPGAPRSASCCRRRCPGITSGCMLAVARAAGETAPLLFTIGRSATSLDGHLVDHLGGRTRRCRPRSSPTPLSRAERARWRGARR